MEIWTRPTLFAWFGTFKLHLSGDEDELSGRHFDSNDGVIAAAKHFLNV